MKRTKPSQENAKFGWELRAAFDFLSLGRLRCLVISICFIYAWGPRELWLGNYLVHTLQCSGRPILVSLCLPHLVMAPTTLFVSTKPGPEQRELGAAVKVC